MINNTIKIVTQDTYQGKPYEIRKTEYSYIQYKDLSKHPMNKSYMVGVVPDAFTPQEGAEFRMHYYEISGFAAWGVIRVEKCEKVVEEKSRVYFEDGKGNKYVLIPRLIN